MTNIRINVDLPQPGSAMTVANFCLSAVYLSRPIASSICADLYSLSVGKSGFDYARKFGIRYHDLPEGADDSFFLCKELIPGYLDEVIGVYQTPQAYYVDDADVEEFDKNFPAKEKLKLPDQIFG